jgi:hypothetical protein
MAYEPKEWVCGDTITADDLNRIEEGVADASQSQMVVKLLAQVDAYGFSTDKSFSEVAEFVGNGNYNVVLVPGSNGIAGGRVFTLSAVNYDYVTGDVNRLSFSSSVEGTTEIRVAGLTWIPSNSNTVSGVEKTIS